MRRIETRAGDRHIKRHIRDMYVERYQINPKFYSKSLYFRAYHSIYNPRGDEAFDIPVEEHENVLRYARTHYYMNEGGYLVRLRIIDKYNELNGLWITLFLPEADAPEYIVSWGRFS